jgi:hypothetical protein
MNEHGHGMYFMWRKYIRYYEIDLKTLTIIGSIKTGKRLSKNLNKVTR